MGGAQSRGHYYPSSDSFGDTKNESEGQIQKTMKGTGMASRKQKGTSINEDTSMFYS